MAYIPSTSLPGQVITTDPAFPQGKARNKADPSDNTGTPLKAEWVNDLWGFLQSLLELGGITPSGDPDEVGASQYLEALTTYFEPKVEWIYHNLPHASDTGRSFYVGTQDPIPYKVKWKPDGTAFYLLGLNSTPTVYQYTVATPWDVTTATYASLSYTVTAAASTGGIAFKPDGTKFYLVSESTDTVYQHTMSTPWNISTASYDSVSLSVPQDATPRDIEFKSDGTKFYILGNNNDTIYQYSLSTPWVLTGGSYDSVSLSFTSYESTGNGMAFASDGSRVFVVGQSDDRVHCLKLTTPWSLAASTYGGVMPSSLTHYGEHTPMSVSVHPDGTKFWVIGSGLDTVREFVMATACHV